MWSFMRHVAWERTLDWRNSGTKTQSDNGPFYFLLQEQTVFLSTCLHNRCLFMCSETGSGILEIVQANSEAWLSDHVASSLFCHKKALHCMLWHVVCVLLTPNLKGNDVFVKCEAFVLLIWLITVRRHSQVVVCMRCWWKKISCGRDSRTPLLGTFAQKKATGLKSIHQILPTYIGFGHFSYSSANQITWRILVTNSEPRPTPIVFKLIEALRCCRDLNDTLNDPLLTITMMMQTFVLCASQSNHSTDGKQGEAKQKHLDDSDNMDCPPSSEIVRTI